MTFRTQSTGFNRHRETLLRGSVDVVRSTGHCSVCGEPGGNCTGVDHKFTVNWQTAESKASKTFFVEEHVYTERQVSPKRKTRVLAASKGSWITEEQANSLGLI